FSYEWLRYPIFPWIGWLHTNRNITIADLNNDAIATLIHTRFALSAAVIMENRQQWRFLTFGVLGSYYSCKSYECNRFIEEVEVRKISIHPN
uniref:Uncharacterized protein n=1 Tax=Anopheles dirus TaxID=7168 RepID=A0A182NVT6_9DIPT